MTSATFGRRMALAAGLEAAAAIERECGRAEQFASIDALLDRLLRRAVSGEPIVDVGGPALAGRLRLVGLDDGERRLVAETYALDRMESRGAWFVPEQLDVRAGVLQFPMHLRRNPRFTVWAIADEAIKLSGRENPDALAAWALLEPPMRLLYRPVERSGFSGTPRMHSERLVRWESDAAALAWLGFDVDRLAPGIPAVVRPASEQVAERQRLAGVLAERAGHPIAGRYRTSRLVELIRRYYAKADREGRALRKRVLAKDVQRTLCAFFGGDWLAFLDYIGESPHRDEDVVTALPRSHLLIGSKPVEQIAAAAGVEADRAQEVLASFFGGRQVVSAVDGRVAVLRRYWEAFDDLHARQAPGMPSLWGLIDDTGWFIDPSPGAGAEYRPMAYLRLAPALLRDIDRLWGRAVLPRAPGRIVISVSPHQLLAEAFGPALRFWHGCGLTVWFITQGPMSRTDLPGMRSYYERDASVMGELGCPPPKSFFDDMADAERLLGEPEPIWDSSEEIGGSGFSFTMRTSRGTSRAGFENVRDLLTRHRREWAAEHLDRYLSARSDGEIAKAAHAYRRAQSDRGRPPTITWFAREATEPANHWFGGDVRDLYTAFGEKCPVAPVVVDAPTDRARFVQTAFRGFGGTDRSADDAADSQWAPRTLANSAIGYLQLEQALDRPPTLKEFGISVIASVARQMKSEPDQVWEWYEKVIAWTRASLGWTSA